MLAPIRRALRVLFHTRLLLERLGKHLVQPPHFAVVAGLGGGDGVLCEVVAQDVQRVDRMHARASLFLCVFPVPANAGCVAFGPSVETGQVDKIITQAGHGQCRWFIAQATEEQGVIHTAVLHQLQ